MRRENARDDSCRIYGYPFTGAHDALLNDEASPYRLAEMSVGGPAWRLVVSRMGRHLAISSTWHPLLTSLHIHRLCLYSPWRNRYTR